MNTIGMAIACKIESTMKIICSKRGWPFDPRSTAAELIKICLEKGLIPSYWALRIDAYIRYTDSTPGRSRSLALD